MTGKAGRGRNKTPDGQEAMAMLAPATMLKINAERWDILHGIEKDGMH